MSRLVGKLRWYPGDPRVEIRPQDLEKVARRFGVVVSVENVKGESFVTECQVVREETMNSSLEGITQTVVTVAADSERAFRECVRCLIDNYRAPRATYSTWGSDEQAAEIIAELADERDGWF